MENSIRVQAVDGHKLLPQYSRYIRLGTRKLKKKFNDPVTLFDRKQIRLTMGRA